MENNGRSPIVRLLEEQSHKASRPPLRPRLMNDANVFPYRGGVLTCCDGQTSFIQTPLDASLILGLLPKLAGRMTVGEILSDYRPADRVMIDHMIKSLWEHGLLRPTDADDEVLLPNNVRIAFQPQIEFLTQLGDRPSTRFDKFRRSRILLIGAGLSFAVCAASLVRIGLASLWLLPTEEENEYLKALEVERCNLERNGIGVSTAVLTQDYLSSSEGVHGFDRIIYCSDYPSFPDIVSLNRLSCREGIPILIGLSYETQSILGPLIKPSQQACWICALRRSAPGIIEREIGLELWRNQVFGRKDLRTSMRICEPIAEALGHDAAFETFKSSAGNLRPESEKGMLFQRWEGPDSIRADFVTVPLSACLGHCRLFLAG